MIYLDYQATTPLAPEVVDAMTPWIGLRFANPHSPSRHGREADAAIELARRQIVQAIGLSGGNIAFTSGATEALNWALKGIAADAPVTRRRIVTIATEHAAVLDSCAWLGHQGFDVVVLPVRKDGLVDLAEVDAAVNDGTLMVAAMLVNNEIGVVQPIADISAIARAAGATMLCDAVQALGRIDIPEGPDLIAVSAHKIHGPKGVGGLWLRDGVVPAPLLHGGGQERGLRSGTLSPALCVGFGAAARLACQRAKEDSIHVERLWQAARMVFGDQWTLNGSEQARYHGNLNIRREGLDASRLLSDCREIAFSLGSACASGSGRPSHVLRALQLDNRQASGSIRLGFGRYTSEEELIAACTELDNTAREQQEWDR